jgi:tRNA-binding protein
MADDTISWDDFRKTDIRVGTIVRAEPFPEARKPSIRLWIDFGEEIGERRSAAGIALNYQPEQLVGRQVCAVVNLGARQIGKFMSECLTVGFPDANGETVLVMPERPVPNGGRLY